MNPVITYVRWQKDEPREQRVFPPLDPTHPAYGERCAPCGGMLGNGRAVQLLALGPADDNQDQDRHRQGGWYSAAALLVHSACIGGES